MSASDGRPQHRPLVAYGQHISEPRLHQVRYYRRLASGIEVDFVVNDMEVAIEVEATA